MKKFFKALACLASLALLAGAFVSCSDDPDDETPAVTYTITYQTTQVTANKPADKTVDAGYKLTTEDLPTLSANGYTFGGWHNGSEAGDTVAVGFEVTANLTLVAKWTEVSSGSDSDDGSDTSPEGTYAITTSGITNGTVTVKVGETPATSAAEGATVTLTVTASTGYTFSGTPTVTAGDDPVTVTKVDGQENQFTFTMPAKAVTVAATFTAKKSTVTFSLNEGSGSAPSNVTATYGEAMPALENFTAPTKTGNTFGGFVDASNVKYYNADGTSARTWDKEDATVELKADWVPEGSHSINITGTHGSGAATVNNSTVNAAADGTSVTVTFTPAAGYKTPAVSTPSGVSNWTKDSGNANVYTFTMGAADVTISVTFEAVEYTITYNLDDGTNATNNPATYTIETESITLAAATKTHYTFDGWYTDSNKTAKVDGALTTKGTTAENLTVWAKWNEISYNISYDNDSLHGTTAPTSLTSFNESDTVTLSSVTPTERMQVIRSTAGRLQAAVQR